jgi:hypothetical protein
MSKRTSYGITPEQFVTAWQTSRSAQEVADKLSVVASKAVPKAIVLARACSYRARGVNLKSMERRNPRKLNTSQLNAIEAE